MGLRDKWQVVEVTNAWQTMTSSIAPDAFDVATDLFYITVSRS
jgi:hypothetical protein